MDKKKIPPGKYLARPRTAVLSESKGGNDQVNVGLVIDEGEYKGEIVYAYLSFTGAAEQYSIEKLRNCGWTGKDMNDIRFPDIQVRMVMENDTFQGKVQTKVKSIYPLGNAMSADRAQSFAERMRSRLEAYDAGKGVSSTGTDEPPPINDEDIPDF